MIIFIEDQQNGKDNLVEILKNKFSSELTIISSMQEGIETIENPENHIKAIICDYHGASAGLIKCLLSLRPEVPYLFITEMLTTVSEFAKKKPSIYIEIVNRKKINEELPQSLERLHKHSAIKSIKIQDAYLVKMKWDFLVALKSFSADIFIRLGENRYIKVFRKEDATDEKDLKKYLQKTQGEYLYLKAVDAKNLLSNRSDMMETLIKEKTPNPQEARSAIVSQIEILQAVISKIGVTSQVQELAKKSVVLTLKLIGSSPKLSSILKRLKQERERYVPNHSLALAEIACALACKIDWNSSGTFMKLSLAAFLHDLALTDDQIAKVQTLSDSEATKDFDLLQLQAIKHHPIQGAEYAKQFREIPPDVDTIIIEHHERPDGSGFPRGLFHQQIAPLSALFIIAHDMPHFFEVSGKDASIKNYLAARTDKFSHGIFKKVYLTIHNDFKL